MSTIFFTIGPQFFLSAQKVLIDKVLFATQCGLRHAEPTVQCKRYVAQWTFMPYDSE